MNTLIPIQEAFCPHCGGDILKKVTFKRNQFTEKQERYFTAVKGVMQRTEQQLVFTERDKKDVVEYFAGTKVSKLSILCENGHRVGFRINDKTGELVEITIPPNIEKAAPVIIEEKKEEPIVIIPVKAVIKEEPKRRVQDTKPETSDFGKVFTSEQEEAWLFIHRHP